jgi:hypothetical protein
LDVSGGAGGQIRTPGLKYLVADMMISSAPAWVINVYDGSTGWGAPTGGTLNPTSAQSDNMQGFDGLGTLGTVGATLLTITIPAGLPYKEIYISAGVEIDDTTAEDVIQELVFTSSNRIDSFSIRDPAGTDAGAISANDGYTTILVSNSGTSFTVALVPIAADANTTGNLFSIRIWGIM